MSNTEHSDRSVVADTGVSHTQSKDQVEDIVFAIQPAPGANRKLFITNDKLVLRALSVQRRKYEINPQVFNSLVFELNTEKSPKERPQAKFTRFKRLPPEIKLKIWQFAVAGLPTQIFRSTIYPGLIPPLLQVCGDSRRETLKVYKKLEYPWLDSLDIHTFKDIYINEKSDIYILEWSFIDGLRFAAIPHPLSTPDHFKLFTETCRRIALDISEEFKEGEIFAPRKFRAHMLWLKNTLPHVREFILICRVKGEFEMPGTFNSVISEYPYERETYEINEHSWDKFKQIRQLPEFKDVKWNLVESVEKEHLAPKNA